MYLALEKILNPYTIKAIEALEGCSIKEISKQLSAMVKDTLPKEKLKETHPLEKYPLYLGAGEVQEILHVCETVAYQVMHCKGCPTTYMGKRMVVQREAFWDFLQEKRGGRLW